MQDFFYDVTRFLIFVNIPINCTYKKTAAHNVSQSHRNEIYNEKLRPGHVGPVKNSQWDKEHVGNRVLKSQCDKGHDGKPDA